MNPINAQEIINFFHVNSPVYKPPEELLKYLQSLNLIHRHLRCSQTNCRSSCILNKSNEYSLGFYFYCKKCSSKYPVSTGSFLQGIKMPLNTVFSILWLWACQARIGCTAKVTQVSIRSVKKLYGSFRAICSWKLLQNPELYRLGGEDHVVQIHELVIIKKENIRDRVVPVQRWICIYSVREKRGAVYKLEDTNIERVKNLILSALRPGTEIWTKGWQKYFNLDNFDGVSPYLHKCVNYSKHFVDPTTGVHSNTVRAYWNTLKNFCRRLSVLNSPLVNEYIEEFIWSQYYGHDESSRFTNLMEHIQQKCSFPR